MSPLDAPRYWRTASERTLRWYFANDPYFWRWSIIEWMTFYRRLMRDRMDDLLIDWIMKAFHTRGPQCTRTIQLKNIPVRKLRRLSPIILSILPYIDVDSLATLSSLETLEWLNLFTSLQISDTRLYEYEEENNRLRRLIILHGWKNPIYKYAGRLTRDYAQKFYSYLTEEEKKMLIRTDCIKIDNGLVSDVTLTPDLLISGKNLPYLLTAGVRVDLPDSPSVLYVHSVEWTERYLEAFKNPVNNPTSKRPEDTIAPGTVEALNTNHVIRLLKTSLRPILLRDPGLLVNVCASGCLELALQLVQDNCAIDSARITRILQNRPWTKSGQQLAERILTTIRRVHV